MLDELREASKKYHDDTLFADMETVKVTAYFDVERGEDGEIVIDISQLRLEDATEYEWEVLD